MIRFLQFFSNIFLPPAGSSAGVYMPVWFKRDERRATGYVDESRRKSKKWEEGEEIKGGEKGNKQMNGTKGQPARL